MEFRVCMSFFYFNFLGKQKFVTAVSSSLGVLFYGSPLHISMNFFPFKCYEFMAPEVSSTGIQILNCDSEAAVISTNFRLVIFSEILAV